MSMSWSAACSSANFAGQAQPCSVGFPRVGSHKRVLEPSYPGRIAPPTWAVNAVLDAEKLVDSTGVTALEEELRKLVSGEESAADASRQLYNQSGLNGLATSGTEGLQSGVFQVAAAQPVNYVIHEVENLFDIRCDELLRGVVPGSFPSQLTEKPMPGAGQRRFIIVDDMVYNIHGKRIEEYFQANSVECKIISLPTQEANKDFELVYEIARQLEAFGINRRKEPIIAIGGGVCLDVAGLTANLFRRNTPIIKIPTTVMAAIDASIGIKTAVNFHNKKNKLGTYCAPLAVFIDRTFLETLDQRNLSNGSAEMLKMACIKDAQLFHMLEEHGSSFITGCFQGSTAGMAMRRSIQGMLEELEYNLWEHILCRLVDYGHTFSPEIEMAALMSGNELLHGEAVNIDMALTTQIAYARELVTLEQRNRVFSVMHSLKLPFWHPVCSPELFFKGLVDTTKARDGLQRVPLMDGVGAAVFVDDLTEAELRNAANVLRSVADADVYAGAQMAMSSVVPKPIRSANKKPQPVAVAL